MPTFLVTSPEGKKYKVNAPEGATQEQAIQYVQGGGVAPEQKHGKTFLQNVGERNQERLLETGKISDLYDQGKIGAIGATVQTAGQGLGLAKDILSESGSSIIEHGFTPKEREFLSKAGGLIASGAIKAVDLVIPEDYKQKAKGAIQGIQQSYENLDPVTRGYVDTAGNAFAVGSAINPTQYAGKAVVSGTKAVAKTVAKEIPDVATAARQGIANYGDELVKSGEAGKIARKKPAIEKFSIPSDISPYDMRAEGWLQSARPVKDAYIKAQEEALLGVKNFRETNTVLKNFNAVQDHITEKSKELVSALEKENKSLLAIKDPQFPTPKNIAEDELEKISELISSRSTLSGDAKAAAEEIAKTAINFVRNNEQTTAGLLKARKDFDKWLIANKEKFFDAKNESAKHFAASRIRHKMNDIIAENTQNFDVRKSLREQSLLYDALDNAEQIARKEGHTIWQRQIDMPISSLPIRAVANKLATGAGISALGLWSPTLAATALGGYGLYKGAKFIAPNVKSGLGNALSRLSASSPKIKNVLAITDQRLTAPKMLPSPKTSYDEIYDTMKVSRSGDVSPSSVDDITKANIQRTKDFESGLTPDIRMTQFRNSLRERIYPDWDKLDAKSKDIATEQINDLFKKNTKSIEEVIMGADEGVNDFFNALEQSGKTTEMREALLRAVDKKSLKNKNKLLQLSIEKGKK